MNNFGFSVPKFLSQLLIKLGIKEPTELEIDNMYRPKGLGRIEINNIQMKIDITDV